ncbi:MAG: FAD-dependent oxidoreductase, partial [Acidobacteriota bacterium]|nr:FAD-dependent oxidoreductase [Acidobacteriota bacterium]
MPNRTIETDVCVVGAGLIGLVHAHEARRRGLSVVLLERDMRARGASVRHAGHLFFSALASGDALDGALLARERWLDLARRAGLLADDAGTLIVARNRDELDVMEGAAADPDRRARILTAAEIEALAPIPARGLAGGFHATSDLR